MRVDEALLGVEKLYFDTAPLIYYVEVNPRYISLMDTIISRVESTQIHVHSSVITLTEVLVQPFQQGNAELRQKYRDILMKNVVFELISMTPLIAEMAAELRAQYNLRTPDAIHMATAVTTNCDAFLTNDMGLKRVAEVNVLILDEIELDN